MLKSETTNFTNDNLQAIIIFGDPLQQIQAPQIDTRNVGRGFVTTPEITDAGTQHMSKATPTVNAEYFLQIPTVRATALVIGRDAAPCGG
jgi:hypothetical protein